MSVTSSQPVSFCTARSRAGGTRRRSRRRCRRPAVRHAQSTRNTSMPRPRKNSTVLFPAAGRGCSSAHEAVDEDERLSVADGAAAIPPELSAIAATTSFGVRPMFAGAERSGCRCGRGGSTDLAVDAFGALGACASVAASSRCPLTRLRLAFAWASASPGRAAAAPARPPRDRDPSRSGSPAARGGSAARAGDGCRSRRNWKCAATPPAPRSCG